MEAGFVGSGFDGLGTSRDMWSLIDLHMVL